jgi:DNA polymerase III epsilon subunit-like protein
MVAEFFTPATTQSILMCLSMDKYIFHAATPAFEGLQRQAAELAELAEVLPELEEPEMALPDVPGKVRVIVLDTETTGSAREDQIIQMGYVAYDDASKELFRYEKVWRGTRPSNPFALRVHGIADHVVRASPHDTAVELRELLGLLDGCVLVAHNAAFDTRMLRQTAQYHGIPYDESRWTVFCTMKGLKKRSVAERGPTCVNGDVYAFLGGPSLEGKLHTALVDARVTAHNYFAGKRKVWW